MTAGLARAASQKKWHVYVRHDADVALVAATVDARRARQLAQTLRKQRYAGARIWASTRDCPVSTSWNRLRRQLSRAQGRVHQQVPPPETDETEDAILARGGTIRWLVWRPI
jgi:hypothetical protein